mgnify:CR=1 FL=1
MQFFGYVRLGEDAHGAEQAVNDTNNPTNATGTPTYTVYGPNDESIANGTCSVLDATKDGLYSFDIPTSSPTYARGVSYTVLVEYEVSGSSRASLHSFIVT